MTKKHLMKLFRLVITAILTFGIALLIKPMIKHEGASGTYPTRPIKLIVPYKPGGGSDRVARIIDEFSEKEFGYPFIFDYKEGGGGHLGIGYAGKLKADGYSILSCNTPEIAIGSISGTGGYSLDDFHFIGQIALDPIVIATHIESEFESFRSFIESAKSKAGKLKIGISGAKGGADLACRDLFNQLGLDIKFIIYTSGSELASAVLGQQVDISASGLTPFLGSLDSIRLLGATEEISHPQLSHIETFKEQGYDLDVGIGRVILTQIDVDEAQVQALRAGLKNIFDHQDFKKRMQSIGKTPVWKDGLLAKEKMKAFSLRAERLIEKYY